MVKTLAFTGHRPQHLGGWDDAHPLNLAIRKELFSAIEEAYDIGYRKFISGMALGVDMWSAESVLKLRSEHTDDPPQLLVAIPFWSQASKWPAYSQKRWKDVVMAADQGYVVDIDQWLTSDECKAINIVDVITQQLAYFQAVKALQQRNEWMVKSATDILAVWNGENGGTGNCVRYALEQGRRVFRITPDLSTNSVSPATLLTEEEKEIFLKQKK